MNICYLIYTFQSTPFKKSDNIKGGGKEKIQGNEHQADTKEKSRVSQPKNRSQNPKKRNEKEGLTQRPVVKTPPSNARGVGLTPGWRAKIPQGMRYRTTNGARKLEYLYAKLQKQQLVTSCITYKD